MKAGLNGVMCFKNSDCASRNCLDTTKYKSCSCIYINYVIKKSIF